MFASAELEKALQHHITAGWRFASGKRKQDAQQQHTVLAPKADGPPANARGGKSSGGDQAAAYGLGTAPDACALWGVAGCTSLAAVDKTLAARARALAHAMAVISAARLAASVAADASWTLAALTALDQCIQRLEAASLGGLGKTSRRAAGALQTTLKGHAGVAKSWAQPHAAAGSGALPAEAVMHVAASVDGCYYSLLEHFLTCGWEAPAVPPPHDYFPAITAAAAGNATACQDLLQRHPVARRLLLETWGLVADADAPVDCGLRLPDRETQRNPLLTVMWARFQEGCRLLAGLDTAGRQNGAEDSSDGDNGGEAAALKGGRWGAAPASDVLRAWRAATREVHVYAYAPPNAAALEALLARSPLLELGAGTGYWAQLLRGGGADVLALDIAPPGPAAAAVNTYHGRIPTVTEVQHGGIAAAGRLPKRALLLCYPPPGSDMAAQALHKYRGGCVCIVGEWDGDTADRRFTAALLAGWRLAQRVALPNWSDSAHELTIWERRPQLPAGTASPTAAQLGADGPAPAAERQSGDAEGQEAHGGSFPAESAAAPQGLPLVQCTACHAPAATGSVANPPHAKPLRRCRQCRDIVFCSKACRKAGGRRHAAVHALRLLFSERKLRFKSDDDFEPLTLC